MKRLIAFGIIALLFSFTALAQDETVFSGEVTSGGYGGPIVSATSVNGQSALFVGGKGGWILNHSFVLGGGGYGLVTDVSAKTVSARGEKYLEVGYGGFLMEYMADPHRLIHFSAGVLIGGGNVCYRPLESMDSRRVNDAFFVAEPGVYVDLNVTTFLRVSVGAQYRFVSGIGSPVDSAGVKVPLTSDADMSGPSAALTLRFGAF